MPFSEISKEQFMIYEDCRKSDVIDMNDIILVKEWTHLSEKEIKTINENYQILSSKFGVSI